MGEQLKRWLALTGFALLVALGMPAVACAAFPVVQLDLPADWAFETQKVIFSEDGRKMALLLQEPKQEMKRALAIAMYDLKDKKWTKIVELSGGVPWEIEPLALNVDGRYLAYRQRDRLVVYDTVKQVIRQEFPGVGSMTRAAFSYGSQYLAFLQNAEWEEQTTLNLYDFYASDSKQAVKTLVKPGKNMKAAGPLQWDTTGALYFIEEYAYGTVSPQGVLKLHLPKTKKTYEQYNTKSQNIRVSNYAASPDHQQTLMVLRELDPTQTKSTYGILIQKNGQFVYAAQLHNWTDLLQNWTAKEMGTIGWVGNGHAFWIERRDTGSTLNIYQLSDKKLLTTQYEKQVYLSPIGVILIIER